MFDTAPDLPEYTEDEKFLFDLMLVEDRYLDLFVFQQTCSVTKYESLYDSFKEWRSLTKEEKEAGKKGKLFYQKIIDEQWRRGREEYEEYVKLMFNGMDLKEEVSAKAYDFVKATVDQLREYEARGFGGKSPIIN